MKVKTPANPTAKARVRIIVFAVLFAIVCLAWAWFIGDLGNLQDRLAARESEAVLQDITETAQIDEAPRQHPPNKLLQIMAAEHTDATETRAATENLPRAIEPPALLNAG